MRQRQSVQRCTECGRGRTVPWVMADEFGTSYLCNYCELDIPTPEDMENEEPDAVLE